ncbi:MAG: branched-chain amino acid ABC transporter permease [Rhizobiaceae bacterium]
MAYFAQQILNGVHVGAIYALLAFGYALAHGVLRRASFLHGALFAFSGQITVYATAFGWTSLFLIYPAALALGAFVTILLTLGVAWYTSSTILERVRHASPNMTIAVSLGLMIVLMEGVRLAAGNWSPWLAPFWNRVIILGGADFTITTTPIKLAITAISAATITLSAILLARTSAGRVWNATCQDEAAAMLMGVNVRKVFVLSMVFAGGLAAIAGILAAWHYGNMDFSTGLAFAVKVLFLTSLGGLSTPLAASLGGLAIGIFENLWDGWFPAMWRDAATYCLLAALLIASRRSRYSNYR